VDQNIEVSQKAVWLRALAVSALVSVAASPEGVQAYLGCAEGCNGAYCWGDKMPPGKVGCYDEIPTPPYCVTYYSQTCSC
jgi:hypothetical protein